MNKYYVRFDGKDLYLEADYFEEHTESNTIVFRNKIDELLGHTDEIRHIIKGDCLIKKMTMEDIKALEEAQGF